MRLKPKVKKAISTPAKRQSKSIIAQRELAERLAQCKEEELVEHLKSFTQWTFGEGDIHNWVDALNRFDEFLSKLAEHYEPQTALDLPILKSSFPRDTVLHVLRVTCLILENSFNRYLYGSAEHLGDLLRIDDPEIVLATLTLLSILVKKTRSRVTTRIHGDPILNAQLFYLTKGWGGKQDGLGLLYCVQDKDVTPKLAVGTTLQFEFFVDPIDSSATTKPLPAGGALDSNEPDTMEVESAGTKVEDASAKEPAARKEGEAASAAGEKATQAGHRSIQFPCFHLFTESNIDTLTQLVTKYSIPRKYHFPLLMRIRLARAFPDVQARRDLVRTNLLAFTVLAQAHMDLGTLSSFFLYEPEFIAELMELVKSDRHTPQDFRILSLDALSALTTDRSRLPKVIAATGSSQHHGELPSMVRKSVATLTGSVEHPIYTLPFIDSLFSFLAALMATPDGIAALNTAGIISTLLPLLRHQNLEHASVLMQCLSILEYYVAGSNSAAAVSLFRDLGGLDLLIERFNTEIANVQKAKEQENTGMSVEGAIEIDAKDKGKERLDTEPVTTTNESSSSLQDDEGEEEESHLSHHQRTLVKTILRILLPFIQGGGRRNIGRLTGVIEGPFPRALCYVLEHYHYFGERIFSLAVSIMSGLINNDPTRFNALAEAGLPRAFLTFVTQGVEPSSSVGMTAVVEANAIGALLSLFTTQKHRKVIKSGDTASRLGAGVDELLRHHPSLRPLGIKAMINALRRVCKMGGLTLPEHLDTEIREDDDDDDDDEDKEDEARAEASLPDVPTDTSAPMAVEESAVSSASSGESVTTPAEAPQDPTTAESMELSSENVVVAVKEEPVEAEQKVPPFVEPDVELEFDAGLLCDYIGNLGRFLETIFANSEHGRYFIEAHGMDLMLKLQSLPELPPTFPSSNAAHSLILAFRSLAAHHTPTLFRGVLENMATKFDSLDSLRPSWRDGSSFLEAEDNAEVGTLASIDCFAGLLAGLVRDPAGLSRPGTTSLSEWITDAGSKVSLSLGHLQRCILWEIAREAHVERKKAEANKSAEVPTEETIMTEAQPLVAGTSSTETQPAETTPAAPIVTSSEGEPTNSTASTSSEGVEKKPDKKDTKQLLIHLVSSIHSVSQGLAKALGARHRNRDEKVVHTLAQILVRTLQEHLTWTPKAYTDDESEAPVRCAYLTSVVGELRSFFFNERHNNTHTLLLHQFNYVDGVTTFLNTFNRVVDIYVHLREKELERQPETTEKDKGKEKLDAVAPTQSSAEGAPVSDVTLGSIVNEQPSTPEADKIPNRDPDMEMAESALLTFGTVLKCLVCGPMVATSPITANMMTQTLPGQQGSFDPHIFLGGIQSRVLLSVLPIWNHPLFAHFPQRFITSLIHANRYIMEGEAAAAAATAASIKPRTSPKPKKQFEPDPGVVTQLMEMGFSQRRAEDALRHIGANNVELAMDWIFTNPEPEPEPAPAVMPSQAAPALGETSVPTAAAAAQATDEMAEAMTEDEELAAALAMSLGQSIEMPSPTASSSAPPPPAKEEPASVVPEPQPKPVEESSKKDEPVDYSKQYDILRKGMLERCVRLLTEVDNLTFTVVDVLSSICKKPDEKTVALTGGKPDERAHVVEALTDQIRLAAAERPPSKALYRLTHALTLLMTENTSIRELVANGDLVPIFLDLLGLLAADSESSKLTPAERDDGPAWLTTVLLSLDTLCQLPSQLPATLADSSSSKRDESTTAESSGVDAMDKDEQPAPVAKEADATLPPMEVPYLLSLPYRKQALETCVSLMQRPLNPDPMQAVLQLSSHLTRDFELAQQFIHQGGLTALLVLPPASSFTGQVTLITTILRHLIEEPSLLQHAMESEIKATITKLMGRSGALVKPRNFLSTVAPLVCRDPVTFLRASANVCRLRDPKPTVSPARVVLCLANPAPPAKSKGSLQTSTGTSAGAKKEKTDLANSCKSKTKRATPSTSVQVITELTNALLTLSRIKKAVDVKPTPIADESNKGKEKSDANVGQESASITPEGDQSLMGVAQKPTLTSGDILQILTDFITTYPPCGSVLLRQQLKKTGAKGKGKEKKDKEASSKRQLPETNNIISYILGELLPCSSSQDANSPASAERQKQNSSAANMLAALAQKPEGRRRVIDEITQAMRKVIADRDQYANYPEVIQALVDFLYLLLTSSASRSHASGFLGEVARLMLDVDTIKTLTAALNSADLNHPDAPQLVNSILKPLEILTRLTAVMSAKSSASSAGEKKPTEGQATAGASQSAVESSSSSSSAPESIQSDRAQEEAGGAADTVNEPQQPTGEGGQAQLDSSVEQDAAAQAGEGDMEEDDARSGENFIQSHAANLTEAIHALSGQQGQQLSNVVNMTLNFIEAANEVMQGRVHSVSDMSDLSDSESDSSSDSDLSDEEREEGNPVLHHPEDEDEEDEGEEDEGVEEEEDSSEEEEEDEEGGEEDAYSYEEPGNHHEWNGQGDFDFSIQIGNQAAAAGRPWSLNVEDLLIGGAPLRDVSLPRAVPPPNPFLAESVESAHPLLGLRTAGAPAGLPGADMAEAALYPLPSSLRGNPIMEDEVRRLFGRVRAQRAGRPGQFGEEGQRTTPGMTEFAASIEPLFVETIRRITLQELKEKEDAEHAEQEKLRRERAEKDEETSKGAEEKATEEPVTEPVTAEAPAELPTPATTESTEATPTVPPAVQEVEGAAQNAPTLTETRPVEPPADAAEPMQTTSETGSTQPSEGTAAVTTASETAESSVPEVPLQPSESAPVVPTESASVPPPEQPVVTSPEEDLGIDPAFLAALPEDLRAEILAEQLHARSIAAASRPPQPAAAAPASPVATPSAPATASSSSSSAAPSSASSSSSSSAPTPSTTSTGAPAVEPAVPAVSTTSISPDFIAALPPEIQAEVLQQEQQSQAAAAAAAADIHRAQAMTTADFFATLSPDLREEILLTQDEASLPPELAAEASALRERALRQYQQYSNRRREGGWGGVGFGEGRRAPVPPEPAIGLGLASRVKAIKGGDIQPLELEGRPIIEPSELVHLVRLLYLAKPLAKGLLHRLFLNLSTHKESRMQLLNIMMTILDAFNIASLASSSTSPACQKRLFASFAEALEALPAVTPSSNFSPLEDPCHSLLSAGTMNTYAHSGQHPPSLVARRVLEILCHLLKHNPRIASFVLGSIDDIEDSNVEAKDKGKEKETTELATTTSSSSSSSSSSTSPTKWCPLARMMDLLGVDQFRNSSAQLDQLLQLLALSVQPLAKLKAREERRKREIEEREARERAERERRERERLRLELEAAEQAMTEEAALAAATAASTEDMQASAAASLVAQPASGTDEGQQNASSVPVGSAMEVDAAQTVPTAATQEAVLPPSVQTEEQPVTTTPAVPSGMEVETPATTTPAEEKEGKMDEEKKEKEEKEPRERTAEEVYDPSYDVPEVKRLLIQVCPQVPVEDLRNLVSILTLENCAEGTYKNATHVLQQLSANALNREVLFKELISAAEGLAEVVVNGLDGLCEELASSFHPTLILSMASSIAELNLLRIIKTVMALPATPAQSTDDFIDSLRLEPLWDALERCLDIITESMEKDAATKGKSKAGDAKGKERDTGDAERDGSKSPAANLLLPIIEVFFVVNAKDPGPLKRSASVIDFGTAPAFPRSGSSSSLLRQSASRDNLTRTMSRSSSLYNLSEQQSRFAMFAEKHRGLLNDLVRQNPALLHGTFKVLLKYPRVLDFDNKRAWFRHQLQKLKDTRGYYGGVRLRINRAKVFEDSYRIMSGRTPEELRGRMTVQFQGEEGIDAGGLTREWYDILAKEVFNADYALFINTAQDNSTFQPNRFSYYNPNHLDYFKFVGRVIGKAILDGYFLPCHFTRSFYKHILGITVQPSDMEAIDPEYYKNLRWILENDPTPLDLTFSSEVDEFGKMRVVDLKEDGKNIAVTNENKHEYVQLVTEMRMTTSIKSQIDAFLGGFHDLIPQDLISIFNEMELELLISGLPEIDLDDLRVNTLYTGYAESSPIIQWFWKIVNSFGQEERAKLLQFVTGTSRVPLDGFKSLRGISGPQKFQIHKSYRKDQLPAAHTCFNQLDLPEYDNYERLREALMYAIRETEGFGFG